MRIFSLSLPHFSHSYAGYWSYRLETSHRPQPCQYVFSDLKAVSLLQFIVSSTTHSDEI